MSFAVDADDLDRQKENVLPLKQGRDPSFLQQKSKSMFSERAKTEIFQQQQLRYVGQIEAGLESGDADAHMEAWSDYISWARQTLINGGKKNEFAIILNDCVNQCKKYRDDYRFLKVCSEFVDFCDKPFAFLGWMESNNIGLCYSLFWETKARLLEDCSHDSAGADKAFDEGIRRNAQPLTRLQERRKELHARVAARINSSGANDDEDEEASGRRVFGALGRTQRSSRTTHDGPGQFRSDVRPENARTRFQVFSEDDGAVASAGQQQQRGGDVGGDQWLAYGSEREAVKENKDMARQWTRVKMPQTPNYVKKPQFEIFDESGGGNDEDVADEPIRPFGNLAAAADKPTKNKKLTTGHKKPSTIAATTAPVLSPITKKKIRAGFDETALQKETVSFEELRAMRWFAANRAEEEERRQQAEEAEELRRVQEDLNSKKRFNGMNREVSFAIDINSTLDTMNYEALVRGAAKTTNLDAIDDLRNVYADTIDLENHLRGPGKLVREPTINTRAVMDEVERMFNDDLALSEQPASGFDIYEDEDSLESFRTSMNASAAAARSSVLTAPPVAAAKLEIFCDEDESFSTSITSAPSRAKTSGSNTVSDPWTQLEGSALSQRMGLIKGYHVQDNNEASYEDDGKYLELDEAVFDLSTRIGGGAHSSVYRAEDVVSSEEDPTSCIKICKPAQAWEFYVLTQVQKRCPNSVSLRHFPRPKALHHFRSESVLILAYNDNGTLAHLIETWSRQEQGLPAELALFYAVELLRILELVHGMKLIHNDISLENIMLDVEADSTMADDQTLQLIDFSRALDLGDYGNTTQFWSDKSTPAGALECPEMRRGDVWCFQPDYYGAASVIHALVFRGKALEVAQAKRGGQWECTSPCPSPMWQELFMGLLNCPSNYGSLQFRESAELIRSLRTPLEAELKQLAPDTVKTLLAKQNILVFEQ